MLIGHIQASKNRPLQLENVVLKGLKSPMKIQIQSQTYSGLTELFQI